MTQKTTDEDRRAAYGWCPKCGAGHDALGYAHLPTCSSQMTIKEKADHVRAARQVRGHTCHWPV